MSIHASRLLLLWLHKEQDVIETISLQTLNFNSFADEAQTALFKALVRTAL
jgi:hypothetical protein